MTTNQESRVTTLAVAFAAALVVSMLVLVAMASAPAEAAFLGQNGKIAYVKENSRQGSSIFTMNPDGSGQSKLTSGNSPSWSADDQKMVFGRFTGQSEEDFGQAIFVRNADGTEQQITSGETYDFGPSFSPDGSKVVFAREIYDEDEDTFTVDVFVMNADGSGTPTNLTNTQGADEMSPVYSPNGSKIAFTRYGATNAEILIMDPNGSNKQNLTNTRRAEEYDPDWSPDGTKIVFTTYSFFSEEVDAEIAEMDINPLTNDATNLTNSATYEDSPAYSPDGTKIVFSRFSYSRTRGERSDIFVMAADGATKATKLTDTRAFEWGPNWQPLPLPQ